MQNVCVGILLELLPSVELAHDCANKKKHSNSKTKLFHTVRSAHFFFATSSASERDKTSEWKICDLFLKNVTFKLTGAVCRDCINYVIRWTKPSGQIKSHMFDNLCWLRGGQHEMRGRKKSFFTEKLSLSDVFFIFLHAENCRNLSKTVASHRCFN